MKLIKLSKALKSVLKLACSAYFGHFLEYFLYAGQTVPYFSLISKWFCHRAMRSKNTYRLANCNKAHTHVTEDRKKVLALQVYIYILLFVLYSYYMKCIT